MPPSGSLMKCVCAAAELAHVETDVVARDQAAITVGRGILDGFRRDRRAELLEARHRDGLQRNDLRVLGKLTEPAVKALQDRVIAAQRGGFCAREGRGE